MFNLLHLLWIVPLSATIGLVTAVFCIEARLSDEEIDAAYKEGRRE